MNVRRLKRKRRHSEPTYEALVGASPVKLACSRQPSQARVPTPTSPPWRACVLPFPRDSFTWKWSIFLHVHHIDSEPHPNRSKVRVRVSPMLLIRKERGAIYSWTESQGYHTMRNRGVRRALSTASGCGKGRAIDSIRSFGSQASPPPRRRQGSTSTETKQLNIEAFATSASWCRWEEHER